MGRAGLRTPDERETPTAGRGNRTVIREAADVLFANSVDGVLIIGCEDHTVSFANAAACRIFGKSSEELVGQMFGEPSDGAEVEIIGAERRVYELRTSTIDLAGSAAWLVVMRDVSERVRELAAATSARAQAEGAAAEQGTLLRELDHRMRNTFQMLSALVHMRRRASHSEEARHALAQVGERIDAIGRSLSALNRAGTHASVSLEPFLRSILGDLTDLRTEVAVTLDIIPVTLRADEAQYVGLIVHELVRNAMKYAFPGAAGGTVAVRATRLPASGPDAGMLEIVVRDDGVGFDPAHTTPGGGLGTELNATLARMLGGRLTIHSGGPGMASGLILPFPSASPAD